MTDPVPWTFGVGGDVAERWEWLTDVMPAPTGPEQRRRLRQSPRITQQFEGMEQGLLRRWMEHLLVLNGAGKWDAPLVADVAALGAAVAIGATTLSADVRLRRYTAGGRVLLVDDADPRTFEICEIASATDTAVTLADATTMAWRAGTRIVPLVNSRLEAIPSLARFTPEQAPVELAFQTIEPVDWTPDAGAATYRTAPVLEIAPVWTSDPVFLAERSLGVEDNDSSIPAVFDQVGIPLSKFTMQFALHGRDELADFWSLLYALAGRWSVIWVPSQANDLRVVANLASASTQLDVEWTGISEWPLQVNRKDIRILLDDGTVLYRRISSVAGIDASSERLVLDSALGVNRTPEQVVMVSFLSLCRQDTDVNLLRYWSHDLVESELTFRSLSHDL